MTKSVVRLAVLILLTASSALASVKKTDRAQQQLAIAPGGVLIIDNVQGNIDVVGGDTTTVMVTADRTIKAQDANALAEAQKVVHRTLGGNEMNRFIRTIAPVAPNSRWTAQVDYRVSVPRTVAVKISSKATGRIRVADVRQVIVSNIVGPVLVENPNGPVQVQNVNGDVIFQATGAVVASARLSSINGSIVVRTPRDANFVWEAETATGELRTAFELNNGHYLTPTRFRGAVNSPGNISIVAETFGGNVSLLPIDADDKLAQPVRAQHRSRVLPPRAGVGPTLPRSNQSVRVPLVQGAYQFGTTIGDVRIDEIRGAANIFTGAGEVHLGTVFGQCEVTSGGGPISLGEIIGPLNARTAAGDITVQRAREGGSVITGGGTIQLLYTAGATRLSSGGGDILVRQANGPVQAETRSGDINIVVDHALKNARMEAKTTKGNISLTLPAGFGADVEAVVVTSDPNAFFIRSDFAGLTMQREQFAGKTRIRATGKINGGGARLDLSATDGGIHIMTDAPRVSPMLPAQ